MYLTHIQLLPSFKDNDNLINSIANIKYNNIIINSNVNI